MIMTGYNLLANAIVIQAVRDYKRLYRGKSFRNDMHGIDSLEKFFRSAWYKELTDVDGEFLMDAVKANKVRLASVE